MTFDPESFVRTFLTTTVTDKPTNEEAIKHLHRTLTSLQYGYFELMFAVAKEQAIQQAMHSGTLDGSCQVVFINGKMRLYEPAVHEGAPMAVPYKKPGTGMRRDREGNVIMRAEWDWDVIWVGILLPIHNELYTWFKQEVIGKLEGVWGFIATHGQDSQKALNTLISALLDEALIKFGDAVDRHGVPYISRARKHGDGRAFKKLTKAEKRMAMRHLLLVLNEDKLNRRQERKRRESAPVSHAETRMSRQRPVTRSVLTGERQFQPRQTAPARVAGIGGPQAILEQLTEQLLAQSGYTETDNSVPTMNVGLVTTTADDPADPT